MDKIIDRYDNFMDNEELNLCQIITNLRDMDLPSCEYINNNQIFEDIKISKESKINVLIDSNNAILNKFLIMKHNIAIIQYEAKINEYPVVEVYFDDVLTYKSSIYQEWVSFEALGISGGTVIDKLVHPQFEDKEGIWYKYMKIIQFYQINEYNLIKDKVENDLVVRKKYSDLKIEEREN
jgi:hypothetical protein